MGCGWVSLSNPLTLSVSVSVSLYLCLTLFLTLGVGGAYGLGFKGSTGVSRSWTRKGVPGREGAGSQPQSQCGPSPGDRGSSRERTSGKCFRTVPPGCCGTEERGQACGGHIATCRSVSIPSSIGLSLGPQLCPAPAAQPVPRPLSTPNP